MESQAIEEFLTNCKIIDKGETLDSMTNRVFSAIAEVGYGFGYSQQQVHVFKERLSDLFLENYFVPSTPVLTNAGRHLDKPLTACSVPPIERRMKLKELEVLINEYHKKGMGTGFNFDDSEDPVREILEYNEIAVEGFRKKQMERPVGNMGILSVDHPKIREFAALKSDKYRDLDWKFNISINLKKDFMEALKKDEDYTLKDGTKVNATELMDEIVGNAHSCGDPGLLFLDRFEEFNITPHLGKYVSLAPCGEIPMASGETCQFAYINVGNFVEDGQIGYEKLRDTISDVVLMLDNSLEISKANINNEKSADMIGKKRKIGVGLCGFSDMLISMGVPYDSQEATDLAKDIMSFINYESKVASVNLAKERGAFPAFYDKETRRDVITRRYLDKESRTVKAEDWETLRQDIDTYGIRHVSTTALPPTGRSSMVIGASPSIEPAFRLTVNDMLKQSMEENARLHGYFGDLGEIYQTIEETGSCQQSNLPDAIKEIYKTCLEISPDAHLNIVAGFQKYTDDSIAKTVNLPSLSTPDAIKDTYTQAYELGLKGITVYRDGCKDSQPMKLKESVKPVEELKIYVETRTQLQQISYGTILNVVGATNG